MHAGHVKRVAGAVALSCTLFAVPALASGDADNRGCPEGWAVQTVTVSTVGHDRWDRNGDGLICSKGNETLPGNAGTPNGNGNTHLGDPESSNHNHKDNNNPTP